MREQRFSGQVAEGPRGSAVIAVPFDPDEVWGAKTEHPEGPQRTDLAGDIDATTRRPDLRAARIAEVVDLLAAGIKERPRPPASR